jgi:hypothetical protein
MFGDRDFDQIETYKHLSACHPSILGISQFCLRSLMMNTIMTHPVQRLSAVLALTEIPGE